MKTLESLLSEDFGISSQDLNKALSYQEKYGGKLEQILVRLGSLSSELLPGLYARLFGIPLIEDEITTTDMSEVLSEQLIAEALALDIIAYRYADDTLYLILRDPSNIDVNEFIASLPHKVHLALCSEIQFDALRASQVNLQTQPSDAGLTSLEEERLKEMASEAPTVNLLNSLIAKGLRRKASDMHIEPYANKGRVRYRIDGVLQDADILTPAMLLPVVTRLKLLSRMDIAEKRRPQDGKIEMRVDGKSLDIRVSALPLATGESLVLRFLLQGSLEYDVSRLGIEPDVEKCLMQDINSTSGVVLLTGPTGSGKTTSLYSFLTRRNEPGIKIITIEDPVEYQLTGVNQVQVQSDIGYTFAKALRSVVRQDPDIIMIGEIRDLETASIALQSSLTGHLVFSTLHTNDAASAYTRLVDLGVEPFLLAAAVKSVVAQRLVRQLCQHCAEPEPFKEAVFTQFNMKKLTATLGRDITIKHAVGCEHCANTGYSGRIAIVEYLRCDDHIKAHISEPGFIHKAQQHNAENGFRTLLEDGILKVLKGITTLDEVLRVAG
ncbi:type II/IV secretion system protein [Rheinheimera sp. D18]|uniref:GspE/PulE family protein n=1 Tax=Rheinheimera sp. D18 TaxID=2545632 RepID=UPI00104CFAF5|nr:ATPase, T2SS/T4P/T4SS family [Rheinheimera sp. D18]QBL09791.1 type II/IV secretion system protein [Rheinheimera sp. D18]